MTETRLIVKILRARYSEVQREYCVAVDDGREDVAYLRGKCNALLEAINDISEAIPK